MQLKRKTKEKITEKRKETRIFFTTYIQNHEKGTRKYKKFET